MPSVKSHCNTGNILQDKDSLWLYLPVWPKSCNTLYRVYRGRAIMSAGGREFFEEGLAQIARLKPVWDWLPYTGPVEIDITLHKPDKRKRDLDNHLKSTLDLMTRAQIWADDSQVCKITVKWGELTPHGAVEIHIHAKRDTEPSDA